MSNSIRGLSKKRKVEILLDFEGDFVQLLESRGRKIVGRRLNSRKSLSFWGFSGGAIVRKLES